MHSQTLERSCHISKLSYVIARTQADAFADVGQAEDDWGKIVPELLFKRKSPLLQHLIDSEVDVLADGYIRKVSFQSLPDPTRSLPSWANSI